MENEFTQEEIKELVRMARVYDPNFTEERYQAMAECQGRLGESRLVEGAGLIVKLERKYGVRGEQAIDRFEGIEKSYPRWKRCWLSTSSNCYK